jgi:hypothetical protein
MHVYFYWSVRRGPGEYFEPFLMRLFPLSLNIIHIYTKIRVLCIPGGAPIIVKEGQEINLDIKKSSRRIKMCVHNIPF